MTELVPAILPESFDDLSAHVARVHALVPRVQLDIANGSYAPTKTWPYSHAEHFDQLLAQEEGLPFWEEVSYELDMLVQKPERLLSEWIETGISAAILHIETTHDYAHITETARDAGIELGWAFRPSTSREQLYEVIEHHGMPDFVQCMGNDDIGYQGIELDEAVYESVADIRKRYPALPIAVDIGVDVDTAVDLVHAGATKLVSGSAVFESEDIKEAIEYFERLTT